MKPEYFVVGERVRIHMGDETLPRTIFEGIVKDTKYMARRDWDSSDVPHILLETIPGKDTFDKNGKKNGYICPMGRYLPYASIKNFEVLE